MDEPNDEDSLAGQLAAKRQELEAKVAQLAELEQRLSDSNVELAQAEVRGERSTREWMRAEQLAERANRELERYEDRFDRTILLIQDGAKALALLNSAAVAAMLALAQSTIAAGSWPRLRMFVLSALISFLVGAIAASVMALPLAKVMISSAGRRFVETRTMSSAFWVTWLPIISTMGFLLGAATLVVGLWRRL